jgi:hypothetical protein
MKVRIFFADRRFTLFIVLVIITGSCVNNDAQTAFEEEAFRIPAGFTQTNAIGQVISRDPDDWRISPIYQQLVFIEPAYPNPTGGQTVNIEVSLPSGSNLTRIDVFVISPNVQQRFLTSVSLTSNAFFELISLNPTQFSITTRFQDALGLNRIMLYDARGRLISYGDIMLSL